MKKVVFCFICFSLMLAVFGCGIKKEFVGKWGYADDYIRTMTNIAAPGEATDIEKAFKNSRLYINDGGTYLMDYGFEFADGQTKDEGTYTINDDTKEITLTNSNGESETYRLIKGGNYPDYLGNADGYMYVKYIK